MLDGSPGKGAHLNALGKLLVTVWTMATSASGLKRRRVGALQGVELQLILLGAVAASDVGLVGGFFDVLSHGFGDAFVED
jgi:hypothetical protein